jgi:predicted metal-dependent hydrolase
VQLGLPFQRPASEEAPGFRIHFVRMRQARRYVMRVRPDGDLRVTIPRGGSKAEAIQFADRHLEWARRQRARVLESRRPADADHELRARAAIELPPQLLALAERHGLIVTRVTIRNQRSRWGSCSSRGHITLNFRLLLMPPEVREYILIHELMHLRQANHSRRFWRLVEEASEGIRYAPLATSRHERTGTRERLLDVARRFPDRLRIELDALACRVILDETTRARGVEYLKGARIYRAGASVSDAPGEARRALASREVILAGGAFNTPQLLMLSGIGQKRELDRHGIPVRVDLPGVGSNLQDRYEVGVVHRMAFDAWHVLENATFSAGDPQYGEWRRRRRGVYTTNGAVLAVVKRSLPARSLPDLFCFALLGSFGGYYPGYSKRFAEGLNYLTWCVLKAHTNNSAGVVRLRSSDPREVPDVNFHYFDEGNDATGADLQSVVEGIKFVRRLTESLRRTGLVAEEESPGAHVRTDEELARFVRDHAWGHHASCSCPIGERDKGGVVNGDFEVHGTKGLRIVDASVFPRIPGFFIVSSVYMIGEKAADVLSRRARSEGSP